MKKPDFKTFSLIGIDEVGRGPIAGPVAVGALCIFPQHLQTVKKLFKGVKESKQLTEEKREMWYGKIQHAQKEELLDFSVTFQSQKIIDTKGLSWAIKKALETSLENLKQKPETSLVLLDGGLKAPSHYPHQKTIIKGDEKEMVIALTSICAKVQRDRIMVKWGIKYPEYGFEIHKGYGTKRHYEAIKKHGLNPLHRRSFCTSITTLAKKNHMR